MKSYEKIRRVKEKEDILQNSEFTCYCKIVSSGKFLQVKHNNYKTKNSYV